MKSLSVTSINVRGLSSANKRLQFLSFLKNLNSDVYLLQETHGMSKFTEWDGLSFFNSGTNSSCGVAVLFNPTFNNLII